MSALIPKRSDFVKILDIESFDIINIPVGSTESNPKILKRWKIEDNIFSGDERRRISINTRLLETVIRRTSATAGGVTYGISSSNDNGATWSSEFDTMLYFANTFREFNNGINNGNFPNDITDLAEVVYSNLNDTSGETKYNKAYLELLIPKGMSITRVL